MRTGLLLVALASCGGRLVSDEPATTPDGSAVGSPVPDDGAAQASITPGANTANGSSPTVDGGNAAPELCPATCTGGCAGGTCTLACGQPCPYSTGSMWGLCLSEGPMGFLPQAACTDLTACPSGRPCQVVCAGVSACQTLAIFSIVCPSDAPCEIICNGVSACQGATIQCPTSASCTVQCSGASACERTTVLCGKGPCTTTCTGLGDQHPSVVGCEHSSSCHNECNSN